jgi:Recombination endonuclease VII
VILKVCLDCQQSRHLDEFPRNKGRADGRGSYCSDCYAVRSRASYAKRRAEVGLEVRPRHEVPEGHARCPACEQTRPLTAFTSNRSARNGRSAYCKPRHNAKSKATAERLYGGTREYHLRRRYGITSVEFDAMAEAQGGVCALCRQRSPEHVDHDHLSGVVRGALCSCCNQGLGNFRDDAVTVRAAADYLVRTTTQRVRVEAGVHRLDPPRPALVPPVADLGPLLAGRLSR